MVRRVRRVVRRVRGCSSREAIDDERLQAAAENSSQLAFELMDCFRNVAHSVHSTVPGSAALGSSLALVLDCSVVSGHPGEGWPVNGIDANRQLRRGTVRQVRESRTETRMIVRCGCVSSMSGASAAARGYPVCWAG